MKEEQTDSLLYRIRHSLAHVMAQVILEMRPHSKLGFGPPIDDGFYYDFFLSAPITESDFAEIENRMRQFIRKKHVFIQETLVKEEALIKIDSMNEPYKKEYAQELCKKKSVELISFYRTGPFVDMCEGPHVESTADLPLDGFKIKGLAGAYWRGDSRNKMMTRIYVWAFEKKADLENYINTYQLAQERDHKKLGKELNIFFLDEEMIGKGLPLWLPNGTVIRDELEKLMKELEFKSNYHRVSTPHLAKVDLYYQTGHLPYYSSHMYPFMMINERIAVQKMSEAALHRKHETYCLKPMNCPHHHRIYASQLRSYRDLPLRLAEYGQVYRFEDSGSLSGLLRVRGMCQNDAHIYCTEEQAKEEFLGVMNLHREVYDILKLSSYSMRFSTWDPEDPKQFEKFIHNPSGWELAQKIVYEAMIDSGLPFVEGKGEAAFYGPKIDFQLKTVTGREETASTNQLDFGVASRIGLSYVTENNQTATPYIIHRAPLGTHERFVAFLIEHYGGAFPTWLAPTQVKVIPISDKLREYSLKVNTELRSHFIRSEIDRSPETFGKKIRNASHQKIPNLLIIGELEQSNGTVTWRRYGNPEKEKQQTLSLDHFIQILLKKIKAREL